ncbi:HEMC, partial [Symbiodinium microadriaticum]
GDAILNQPLSAIGGKGLFTKELDTSLLNNEVDICVHSMKDVPTQLPPGTVIPCYLPREETNDVFISEKYSSLGELPDGAVIGSASLRRQAQLLAMNPTFKVVNFRGNVQTRLKKLRNGDVDATLLALAGLKRLGMDDLVAASCVVNKADILPAVAQGAIGIQCRANDQDIVRILQSLNDPDTEACVDCERAFLAELDGNCRTPIAGQATLSPSGTLRFQGMVAKADGSDVIYA